MFQKFHEYLSLLMEYGKFHKTFSASYLFNVIAKNGAFVDHKISGFNTLSGHDGNFRHIEFLPWGHSHILTSTHCPSIKFCHNIIYR